LFHTIAEVFGKECEVLAVWHDERIVAGVLTLLYEDQVVPCYGAALPERHIHGAADFMYWELMCHAARSGYQHILSDGQRLPDVTA